MAFRVIMKDDTIHVIDTCSVGAAVTRAEQMSNVPSTSVLA